MFLLQRESLIEIPNHDYYMWRIYLSVNENYIEFHQKNIHGLIIRCQWNISNDKTDYRYISLKGFSFLVFGINLYFLDENTIK